MAAAQHLLPDPRNLTEVCHAVPGQEAEPAGCNTAIEVRTITGVSSSSVAFSRDGLYLALGVRLRVRILQLTAPRPVFWKEIGYVKVDAVVYVHEMVTSLAFSPVDSLLAGAVRDVGATVWGISGPPSSWTGGMKLDGPKPVHSLAWSPDGRYLVTCGDGLWLSGMVGKHLWRVLWNVPGRGLLLAVAFSPDGERLVAGGADWTVQVWDVSGPMNEWREMRVLAGHSRIVTSIVFPSAIDAPWLATGSQDATVRIWDLTGTRPDEWGTVKVLSGQKGLISTLAFSPSGLSLASGSLDGTIRIWDLSSTRFQFWRSADELPGPREIKPLGTVHSVAWSVEGLLASSAGDSAMYSSRIWDVKDIELVARPDSLRGRHSTVWRGSHLESFLASFHSYPNEHADTKLCDSPLISCTTVRRPCSPDVELPAVDLTVDVLSSSVAQARLDCIAPFLPPLRLLKLTRVGQKQSSLILPQVEELVLEAPQWGSSGSAWLINVLKASRSTLRRLDISGTAVQGDLEADDVAELPFLEFVNISETGIRSLAPEWILGRTVVAHGTQKLTVPGLVKLRSSGESCGDIPWFLPCFQHLGHGVISVREHGFKDGQLHLDTCEPGEQGPGLGTSCSPCAVGFWSDGLLCRSCSSHQTTLSPSSTSARDCLCYPGYVRHSDGHCGLCPRGFNCMELGTQLRTASALPGFWRSSSSTTAVKCAPKQVCIGGPPERLCREGHRGAKCAECEDGYFLASGGFCTRCFESWNTWWPFILVALGVALALLIFALRQQTRKAPGAEPSGALSPALTHAVDRLLALMQAFQLLALVSTSGSPALRPGRNFNLFLFETREITDPLRPACWMSPHTSQALVLLLGCAQPLLLCLALLVAISVSSRDVGERLARAAKIMPGALTMTLTGALASMARLLECDMDVPEGDDPWLKRLSFVKCRSRVHLLFGVYAVGLTVVHCVVSMLVFWLPASQFSTMAAPLYGWIPQLHQQEGIVHALAVITCEPQRTWQMQVGHAPLATAVPRTLAVLHRVVKLTALNQDVADMAVPLDSEATTAVASRLSTLAVLGVRAAIEMALLNHAQVENVESYVTLRVGSPDLQGPELPQLVIRAPPDSSASREGGARKGREARGGPAQTRASELDLTAAEEHELKIVMQERLLMIYLRQKELAPFISNLKFLRNYHRYARHFDSILKVTTAGFAFSVTFRSQTQQALMGLLFSGLTILLLCFQPWVLRELMLTALVTYCTLAVLHVRALLDALGVRLNPFVSQVIVALPLLRFLFSSVMAAIPRLRRRSVQHCCEELLLSVEFQLLPLARRAVKELAGDADCVPSLGCPEDRWDSSWSSAEPGAVQLVLGTAVVPLLRCGPLLEVRVLEGNHRDLRGWLPAAALKRGEARGASEQVELWEWRCEDPRHNRDV